MPQAPIPFYPDQQSGFDPLGGESPIAMNVVVQGSVVRRRPGITTTDVAPDEVVDADGISAVHTTTTGTLYAVGGVSPTRSIYRVTPTGAGDMSSGVPSGDLRGTSRPIIAETQSILAVAGGDRMQKVVIASSASSPITDAPFATHVVATGGRLVANNPEYNGYIDISDIASGSSYAGFEVWTGTPDGVVEDDSGYITTNSRPDPVVALAVNGTDLFAFGTTSTEAFSPSGASIFAPAGAVDYGCSAPYSVVKVDRAFAWLDSQRRIVASDGRTVNDISKPVHADLMAMSRVDDAWGFRYLGDGMDLLVWTFPEAGRSFCYQKDGGWSQWSGYNGTAWTPLTLACHHQAPGTGKHIVGTTDGYIRELATTAETDNGTAINAYVITGYQNRGTDSLKRCRAVRLVLRRGRTEETGEPLVLVSYRDGLGPFSAPIPVGLGTAGAEDVVVILRGLGAYRRRQWKFEFTGSDSLILAGAIEEYDVLGS